MCWEVIDDREVEVRRLDAEHDVEALPPTRAGEFYISQHLTVIIPAVLRAAKLLPLCVHPLQMLVKAELVSVLNNFLEVACIGFENHCTVVALACFSSSLQHEGSLRSNRL